MVFFLDHKAPIRQLHATGCVVTGSLRDVLQTLAVNLPGVIEPSVCFSRVTGDLPAGPAVVSPSDRWLGGEVSCSSGPCHINASRLSVHIQLESYHKCLRIFKAPMGH